METYFAVLECVIVITLSPRVNFNKCLRENFPNQELPRDQLLIFTIITKTGTL